MSINGNISKPGDYIHIKWSANQIEKYIIPISGLYRIIAYGALNDSNDDTDTNAYGGISEGYKLLRAGTTLYIGCGHIKSTFNGGGLGINGGSNGSGATHVALKDGTLASLVNDKESVLLVAGGAGGGGGNNNYIGGSGGGESGTSGSGTTGSGGYGHIQGLGGLGGLGGNQNTGAGFGQGSSATSSEAGGAGGGGGGGWYGGYGGAASGGGQRAAGGGGSGYIGGVPSITFNGRTYNPTMRTGASNMWEAQVSIFFIEAGDVGLYNIYHNETQIKNVTGKTVNEIKVNDITVFSKGN